MSVRMIMCGQREDGSEATHNAKTVAELAGRRSSVWKKNTSEQILDL